MPTDNQLRQPTQPELGIRLKDGGTIDNEFSDKDFDVLLRLVVV